MTTAIPYNLRPKATKLAEGPDDSLEPSVTPTDAERRGIPPIFWAAIDKSKGGTAPPDAPLAPPPTDSAHRSVAPLVWPKAPAAWVPNRPLRELAVPVPDLDPDIALWPVTIVSRWPFAGPPSVGIWPKGWMGVDNTATVWVCTVAGEPGTWTSLGGGTGGAFPTFTGSGSPQGVQNAAAVGNTYQDTVHGGIWVAGETGTSSWLMVGGRKPASGTLTAGVYEEAPTNAGTLVIAEASAEAGLSDVAAQGGTGNGAYWNSGPSDGEQTFVVNVGSSGQFSLIFKTDGEFNIPAAFVLSGIPTSDPSVSDEVWNDNGVLVMSGSTPPPLGDTGWVDMTLLNGWGTGVARYRKLNGIVTLELSLSSNAATAGTIATLPAGFRPNPGGLGNIGIAVVVNNGAVLSAGYMTVANNGDVVCDLFAGGQPSTALQYGTISYPADA